MKRKLLFKVGGIHNKKGDEERGSTNEWIERERERAEKEEASDLRGM